MATHTRSIAADHPRPDSLERCGVCGSSSADAGSCSWPSSCCSPTPVCCSVAGSGTAWRTRRPTTRSSAPTRARHPRRSSRAARGAEPRHHAAVRRRVGDRHLRRLEDGHHPLPDRRPRSLRCGRRRTAGDEVGHRAAGRPRLGRDHQPGLTDPSQVPAPPSGTVTVTGSVRRDADGSSAQVVDGSARAISSATIQPAIGIPVYGGFVDLKTESPAAATPLESADLPDLSNGPHFFYALQVVVLRPARAVRVRLPGRVEEATGRADLRRAQQPAKKQKRTNLGRFPSRRHRARSMPPSTGSITPVTKDAAGLSRNAAARPNARPARRTGPAGSSAARPPWRPGDRP